MSARSASFASLTTTQRLVDEHPEVAAGAVRAIVKAQKAGLNTRPSCSFVSWKAPLIGPATSPRMANTIEVVTSDTQLATNSLCLFMPGLRCAADLITDCAFTSPAPCRWRPEQSAS